MAPYSFTRAKELGILQPKEIERFAILYMYMHEEIKVRRLNNAFIYQTNDLAAQLRSDEDSRNSERQH